MDYKARLIDRIKDSNKWPVFERPDFLSELDAVAEKAYKKNTVEGYLASVLIYSQLCEEILKILIECSQFYIQLSVFPAEIHFRIDRKRMFGQLIKELENCISFEGKEEFIKKCMKLNTIRIEIVHKLTLKFSLIDIKTQTKQVKVVYNDVFQLFEDVYDNYRVGFHGYEKNVDWDDYINES